MNQGVFAKKATLETDTNIARKVNYNFQLNQQFIFELVHICIYIQESIKANIYIFANVLYFSLTGFQFLKPIQIVINIFLIKWRMRYCVALSLLI